MLLHSVHPYLLLKVIQNLQRLFYGDVRFFIAFFD